MAAAQKPIKIFVHATGPNPPKVIVLCEELQIPYELEYPEMSTLHTPAYEKYNPNGRLPTIIDPNTDLTLWESGAIIKYLIDRYDTQHKLSHTTFPETAHTDQFLFFQVSGQGPYFGQFAWFAKFHHEKLPSAVERYKAEVKRVTKVLNSALEGKQWLVGEKCTYADLSFVTWYWSLSGFDPALMAELESQNPNWADWNKRLNERPGVKKAFDIRMAKLAALAALAPKK